MLERSSLRFLRPNLNRQLRDDDTSGDVSWTGMNNLIPSVSSEFMDDFT